MGCWECYWRQGRRRAGARAMSPESDWLFYCQGCERGIASLAASELAGCGTLSGFPSEFEPKNQTQDNPWSKQYFNIQIIIFHVYFYRWSYLQHFHGHLGRGGRQGGCDRDCRGGISGPLLSTGGLFLGLPSLLVLSLLSHQLLPHQHA